MQRATLSEVKNDLWKYLQIAETEEVLITRHGNAAGLLLGFASQSEWLRYEKALQRIEQARDTLRKDKGEPVEEAIKNSRRRTKLKRRGRKPARKA
jgi:prevent-host-death family protein